MHANGAINTHSIVQVHVLTIIGQRSGVTEIGGIRLVNSSGVSRIS